MLSLFVLFIHSLIELFMRMENCSTYKSIELKRSGSRLWAMSLAFTERLSVYIERYNNIGH